MYTCQIVASKTQAHTFESVILYVSIVLQLYVDKLQHYEMHSYDNHTEHSKPGRLANALVPLYIFTNHSAEAQMQCLGDNSPTPNPNSI